MQQNPQLELAYNFVQFTNKNIFLTGKAGTGKTTFLHSLKTRTPKRMVVVAPTGVAAINAGGVTVHSFFQLPFGPFIPEKQSGNDDDSRINYFKFRKDKIRIIRGMDLLVIDEISMVRADLLDGIDTVLRKYRDRTKPFGGVQLLMIGDLHQLSPIVKDDEWRLLCEYYDTAYFFSSKALKLTQPVNIELTKIYRQSDKMFIDILNEVRQNKISPNTIIKLNERYLPDFKPKEEDGYITLTTHNATAQNINAAKLSELKQKSHYFNATIKDDFPSYMLPTEEKLELKVGAQVMFIKNDLNPEKQYFNGKIGQISDINSENIYVQCPGENSKILVQKTEWNNVKYELDELSKQIKEVVVGTFTQYPLKLAWAITIHKSQGLTFERAIVDANLSFAHGQVYVALSRCKTFEGLVLSTPIGNYSVKTDGTISDFTENISKNIPSEDQLNSSKIDFQKSMISELFDFNKFRSRMFYLQKLCSENPIGGESFPKNLKLSIEKSETEIFKVAEKFKIQLNTLSNADVLPENNPELQERIQKASTYFLEKIEENISKFLQTNTFDTDNKTVAKTFDDTIDNIRKDVFIKKTCLKNALKGFSTLSYIQTKANAEIDYTKPAIARTLPKTEISEDVENPILYAELKKWRDALADENDVSTYMVVPFKVLKLLCHLLPTATSELAKVKGFGKIKVKQYGKEIVEIISAYVEKTGIQKQQIELNISEKKENKQLEGTSNKASFDLFLSGKSVAEIAAERNLAVSTIEGHLAYFVGTGELNVNKFVSEEKINKLTEYFTSQPDSLFGAVKTHFGDEISYTEMRFVKNYIDFNKNNE